MKDEYIEEMLFKIGITPNLKGFNYIKEAVKLIDKNPNQYCTGITKKLYPDVAKLNNVTSSAVERGIRHAITRAINLDYGEIEKYLKISPYKNKITNSEFLYSLLLASKRSE